MQYCPNLEPKLAHQGQNAKPGPIVVDLDISSCAQAGTNDSYPRGSHALLGQRAVCFLSIAALWVLRLQDIGKVCPWTTRGCAEI